MNYVLYVGCIITTLFFIVESWLDDDVFNSEISILVIFFRLNRGRHGGGILIFVKSELVHL